jgi:hypothetical protein
MIKVDLGHGIFAGVAIKGGLVKVVISDGGNSRTVTLDLSGQIKSTVLYGSNILYPKLSPSGLLACQSEAAGWHCIVNGKDCGPSQQEVAINDIYASWRDLQLGIHRLTLATGVDENLGIGPAAAATGVAYLDGDTPISVWEAFYQVGPPMGLLNPRKEADCWVAAATWGGIVIDRNGPYKELAAHEITADPHIANEGDNYAVVAWDNEKITVSVWILTGEEIDALPLKADVDVPPIAPPILVHVDPFDHPMWVGCYFDLSGKYGDTKLPVNVSIPGDPSDTARATLPVIISKAHLGSEKTPIVALYCESGDQRDLEAQIRELKGLRPGVDILGLCDGWQPLGKIAGDDIIGLELYSDATLKESPESIKARVKATMDILPKDQRIALVPQAFDHLGAYTLDWIGIFRAALDLARDPRVVLVAPFCAGRADNKIGVISEWFKAFAEAVGGPPAITIPTPPPVVVQPPPVVTPPPAVQPPAPIPAPAPTPRPRGGIFWAFIRAVGGFFGFKVR